jgi:hypothetical protein
LSIIEKEIAYYSKFSELLPYLEKENPSEEELASYNSIYAEVVNLESELGEANDNLLVIQEEFAEKY